MLNEIQRRLSKLETIIKLLVEVEKDQKRKHEQLVGQFHLYLNECSVPKAEPRCKL
jgi:hypothetical protein